MYSACLRTAKTREDRRVVNHCVQVRLTFNILDIEESIRREIKKGARRKHSSGWKTRFTIFETKNKGHFWHPFGLEPMPLASQPQVYSLRLPTPAISVYWIGYIRKYWSMAFSLACFFLAVCLLSKKTICRSAS